MLQKDKLIFVYPVADSVLETVMNDFIMALRNDFSQRSPHVIYSVVPV